MAKFIEDTKSKIQDLFVYLVSCGKSSKEPGNDQQGLIEGQGHGLVIIPAANNAPADYEPIAPINNEPANAQANDPVVPISDEQENGQEGQQFAIFPAGDPRNDLIYYYENNTNGDPAVPQGRANISKPPGRRIPTQPRTG